MLHEALRIEQLDVLLAEALDVHGSPGSVMPDLFQDLRFAVQTHAPVGHFTFFPLYIGTADRAVPAEAQTSFPCPVLFSWITVTTWGITSPARSTTTVSPIRMSLRSISSQLCRVERDTVTPPMGTGFSMRDGRDRSRPAHTGDDVLDDRRSLVGGELEGYGPAGLTGLVPQRLLKLESVHLDHGAIGLEGQTRPLFLDLLDEFDDLIDPGCAVEPGRGREMRLFEPVDEIGLTLEFNALWLLPARSRPYADCAWP